MYFQSGIINVFLAILIIYLIWNKSANDLIIGLFYYCTFHFCYSAIVFNSSIDLINIHSGSNDMIIKITGVVFVLFIFLQLVVQSYRDIFNEPSINLYFGVVIGLVFIGFIIDFQSKTRLQIQNFLSIEAMLLLILLIYTRLKQASPKLRTKLGQLWILNVIIAVALVIAFYEVFFQHAWSWYSYNGHALFRASSFLFNPNLFGMWCALVALVLSYLFHRDDGYLSKKPIIWGLLMISACIYLSGSRSFIYLLILMLVFSLPLIKSKTKIQLITPLAIVLSTFFTISSVAGLMATHSKIDVRGGWQSIEIVGERILYAPLDLAKYGVGDMDKIDNEIAVAIDGRFKGDSRDSGILTLYDDVGWLGLIALLWLGLIFLVWACKAYWIKRDIASAYALVMLIFYGAVGVSMRYQVFPVWIFVAVGLSPCLLLWRRIIFDSEKNSQRIYK